MYTVSADLDEDELDQIFREFLEECYKNSAQCDPTESGEKDRKAFRRVYKHITPHHDRRKW